MQKINLVPVLPLKKRGNFMMGAYGGLKPKVMFIPHELNSRYTDIHCIIILYTLHIFINIAFF